MIHVSRPIDKIKNISIARCTGKSNEDRERYKIHYESPPIQPKKMLLAVIVDKQQTNTYSKLYAMLNRLKHDHFHAIAIT